MKLLTIDLPNSAHGHGKCIPIIAYIPTLLLVKFFCGLKRVKTNYICAKFETYWITSDGYGMMYDLEGAETHGQYHIVIYAIQMTVQRIPTWTDLPAFCMPLIFLHLNVMRA